MTVKPGIRKMTKTASLVLILVTGLIIVVAYISMTKAQRLNHEAKLEKYRRKIAAAEARDRKGRPS